jgi:hypothetical protein
MTNWKERAVAATRGSQFGAVFCAAAGLDNPHVLDDRTDLPAPHFSGKATITSDNYVMATFWDRNGVGHSGAFVGSIHDVIRNTKGLADHLALTEEERAELVAIIRGWIAQDYSDGRALKTLE